MRSQRTPPLTSSHPTARSLSDGTLLEKLYIYETVRFKSRAVGYVLSAAMCFGYCLYNANVLGRPEKSIIYECLGLAALLSFLIPILQVHMESMRIRWPLQFNQSKLHHDHPRHSSSKFSLLPVPSTLTGSNLDLAVKWIVIKIATGVVALIYGLLRVVALLRSS